ncbi:hypothetical protein ACVPOR_11405 [Staphylococcus aureus]
MVHVLVVQMRNPTGAAATIPQHTINIKQTYKSEQYYNHINFYQDDGNVNQLFVHHHLAGNALAKIKST